MKMKDWAGVMKVFPLMSNLLFRRESPFRSEENLNTTQQKTLMAIYDNPGKSQTELIRYLDREKGALSKNIQSLVQKDLVVRSYSETDRRKVFLTLTEKGKNETDRIRKRISEHTHKTFSVLSAEEQSDLYRLLEQLLDMTLIMEERLKGSDD